jgi:hypothetical protein
MSATLDAGKFQVNLFYQENQDFGIMFHKMAL